MARPFNPCPAQCSAANPHQNYLDAAELTAAGVTGDWITGARECGYCHAVYSIGPDGKAKLRGYFKADLIAPGHWEPVNA